MIAAFPPMPVTPMGGSETRFQAGLTAVGEMRDTSAKVSGPTVMRVASSMPVPTNELNTPTTFTEVAAE